jgi:hypothetical protein
VFLGIGVALNQLGGLPPAAALGALMSGIESLDVALDELTPASGTLSDLNSSAAAPIPYTVIAGNASALEQWQRLFGKLVRQGVGILFPKETHDMAVGYSSMTRIRDGQKPQPRVIVAPCTHVNYFSSTYGREALQQVITELRGGNVSNERSDTA